ncbi:MAG: hypothetical protein AVDCRST_MAG53-2658 [uncultured Solirubrobacteraceae bacterium]|uniref:Uncharacterized protein n=1 Tax=uncultured Solirubrobacteraceae bacterium TaxID=1162706 RepID=A0A6J4T2V8_9ACTN|nr:MAG: hypothetical protein AVDCRST_MAG53-2658 [uncultured Solirubrobacteraceae bacterium]
MPRAEWQTAHPRFPSRVADAKKLTLSLPQTS